MNSSGLQTKMKWQGFPPCPKFRLLQSELSKVNMDLAIFKRGETATSEGDTSLQT